MDLSFHSSSDSHASNHAQCARAAPKRATHHPALRPGAQSDAWAAMTGGIVHDFRTILAVIEAGASVAERHINEPDQIRRCVAGLRDGVRRGLNLTSRLLEFVQGHEAEPKPEDLNALIRQLEQFLTYAAGPQVRVELNLSASLPCCVVDASQFNAAMLNLVVNARDAMPGGGVVQIATSVSASPLSGDEFVPPFVHVSVKDDGVGMSRRVLRKVFDPFFTTKGEAGTGLGLATVFGIARQSNGDILVRSGAQGTAFELLLPLVEYPAAV